MLKLWIAVKPTKPAFIFDIIILVNATVIMAIKLSNAADHISCSVSLILMCVQNCDRFKITLLPKVKNITQDLGFDELARTQVTVTMLTIESTRNSVVLFF